MRNISNASRPVFRTPMQFDWTDEKLQAMSQEQLLTLLQNLDHQRAIGRIAEDAGASMDMRITALLTKRNCTKRRKDLAKATAQSAPASNL